MKNFRLIFVVIVSVVVAGFSGVILAEKTVTTERVELKCGRDIGEAEPFSRDGEPYTQYTVKMLGMLERGIEGIIPVIERTDVRKNKMRMEGGSQLPVIVYASCMPRLSEEDGKRLALSQSYLACKEGKGIELELGKPNDEDPDKFHAVVEITKTVDEEAQAAAAKHSTPEAVHPATELGRPRAMEATDLQSSLRGERREMPVRVLKETIEEIISNLNQEEQRLGSITRDIGNISVKSELGRVEKIRGELHAMERNKYIICLEERWLGIQVLICELEMADRVKGSKRMQDLAPRLLSEFVRERAVDNPQNIERLLQEAIDSAKHE